MKIGSIVAMLGGLLLAAAPLPAQVKQSHSLVISFLQLKEHFNLGMVFNGIQTEYRYGLRWEIGRAEIVYQPKLAAGIAFKRGMAGYQIAIAPVNLSGSFSMYEKNGHTVQAGIHFGTDYSYQMYPDLHGGHLFWMSEIGLSPLVKYRYQWNNKRIDFYGQNSIAGFVSHTQSYDPYFYSFKFGDFFTRPHEKMAFGSFDAYNHSFVSAEFTPNVSKIHSFALEMDYFSSHYGERFQRLNYNVLWKMQP